MSRRIDEQLWFRASAGLMATVILGLMLNWLGPSMAGMPVVGAVIVQLCRVVNATCADETARSEPSQSEPPVVPVPRVAEASEEKTDTHGNSLGDPIELEDLDDTDPLAGSLGPTDRERFYRFTLSSPSLFRLLIDGKAAHVLLLDARGEPVARGKNSGLVESISQSLEPGTYNVLVQQNSGREGAYHLNLSLQPRP